jgi:hypothetical protein
VLKIKSRRKIENPSMFLKKNCQNWSKYAFFWSYGNYR